MRRIPETESLSNANAFTYFSMTQNPIHHKYLDVPFVNSIVNLDIHSGLYLDIGTGPGQIPLMLLKALPHISFEAIDLSSSMVTIARKGAIKTKLNNRLRLKLADAVNLPFKDNCFDVVISHFFLEHVPNESKAIEVLKEINRVAKVKAPIYIEDVIRPDSEQVLKSCMQRTVYIHEYERQNFEDSIRAAFSYTEWRRIIKKSRILVPNNPSLIINADIGVRWLNDLPRYIFFKRNVLDFEQ